MSLLEVEEDPEELDAGALVCAGVGAGAGVEVGVDMGVLEVVSGGGGGADVGC